MSLVRILPYCTASVVACMKSVLSHWSLLPLFLLNSDATPIHNFSRYACSSHQRRRPGQPNVRMALLLAYAVLQLDPEDRSRMAAFETFCWQHILNHASRDWTIACQNGSIKLQLLTSKTSDTQGFKSFDSTLNTIAFEFVRAYAPARSCDFFSPLAEQNDFNTYYRAVPSQQQTP